MSATEIQRAIDSLVGALDLTPEAAADLRRASTLRPHVANGERPGRRRGPYRTPLERRIELIRFVWDNSACVLRHLS